MDSLDGIDNEIDETYPGILPVAIYAFLAVMIVLSLS